MIRGPENRVRPQPRGARPGRSAAPALVLSIVALAGVLIADPTVAPSLAQTPYPTPRIVDSPAGPTRVDAGDLNSDGLLDLAVNAPASGRIFFHFSRGGLVFGSRTSVEVGGAVSDLRLADMDGDGLDDVVWVEETLGRVGIHYRRGATPVSFDRIDVWGGDEPSSLDLFDRDGDGDLDVVVAFRGSDAIRWFRNTGVGLAAWDDAEVGDGPARVLVVPTSDGRATLAVAQAGFLSRDLRLMDVQALTGTGVLDRLLPAAPSRADLDGDGWAEILAPDAGSGEVSLLGRQGAGWTSLGGFTAQPGVAVAASMQAAPTENRVLAVESTRNRLTIWDDPSGTANFAQTSAWYLGSQASDCLLEDLDGDGSEEIVVALPEFNQVKIVEALGDGLLAQRAVLAPDLPVRVERDGSLATSDRFVVLGVGLLPEARVYAVVNGEVVERGRVLAPAVAREVALADADGANDTDLFVLDNATGVWRALDNGNGGFGPLQLVAPVAGALDFEVVDVVGSSAKDLVVSDPSVPGIRIFLGDGAGGFLAQSTRATQQIVHVVRARDLDLDGRDDLITLGEINELYFFYGSATGPGAGVRRTVGANPRDLAFGRFNDDPYADIVICNTGTSSFSLVMSTVSGLYSVATTGISTSFGAQNCDTFDANGDGYDDVLMSAPNSSSMALHLNTGNPSVGIINAFPIVLPATVTPVDVRAMQIDGDGIADLIVIDHLPGIITVMRSDPLQDVPVVQGTLTARWDGDAVRLEVFADARRTNELEVRRTVDERVLALEPVGPGRWTAFDATPPAGTAGYRLSDLRGNELDRIEVAPDQQTTGVDGALAGAVLLPARFEDGDVRLRFRVPGNSRPTVRVYDLRGRSVAELRSTPGDDGWYEARWRGEDRTGSRTARGRYLVRVQEGGTTLVTSVTVR